MDPIWMLVTGVTASTVALARYSMSLQRGLVDRWIQECAVRDAQHAASQERLVEAIGLVRLAVAETNTLLRREAEWRQAIFREEDLECRFRS